MTDRKTVRQIWRKDQSGLILSDGTVSDLSWSSSKTYLRIKEKAIEIEDLYEECGIAIPPGSDLADLIQDSKTLSDSWLLGEIDKHPMSQLFRAALFDRISESTLLLKDVTGRDRFLKALVSGSLDLLNRERSIAKDLFWEIELWAILKRRSFDTLLEEPPDIVVNFGDSKIGIACKKLYSEKNVEKVLSEAVSQIEASFDFGIVAVNIDDLLPADKILRSPDQESMAQYINNYNSQFINNHERHFRKYLVSGRIISVLVSTSVLSDLYDQETRLNNARQSTMWTIPGLPSEKAQQLKNFYEQLNA